MEVPGSVGVYRVGGGAGGQGEPRDVGEQASGGRRTVDRDNMAQVAQIHRNRLDSFILG